MIDVVLQPADVAIAKDKVGPRVMVRFEPLGHGPVVDKSLGGIAPIRAGGFPVNGNNGGGAGVAAVKVGPVVAEHRAHILHEAILTGQAFADHERVG